MTRKLSEILNEMNNLSKEYNRILIEEEDNEDKEIALTTISLALDCLDTCLMYGDYENDTGKEYNYYED